MAEDESGWSLTESDPLVFTQLMQEVGIKGLQVDDLYSLDPSTLTSLQPIHALIFLFKWVSPEPEGSTNDQAMKKSGGETVGEEEAAACGVYFANQVINNACATIATVNAVMNILPQQSEHEGESIEHGAELNNLKEFGVGMDAMTLGHLLSNSELLRTTHNSFTSSSPFSITRDPRLDGKEKEDAYHFISYVPKMGCIWELDGLREGPVRHGACGEGEAWVDAATEVIRERIGTYPEGSLMFNLLAIRSSAIPRLTRLISNPTTDPSLIPTLTEELHQEQAKQHRMKLENGLRRSNLVGMILESLKVMAKTKNPAGVGEEGKTRLEVGVELARAKGKEKREKALKGMDVD